MLNIIFLRVFQSMNMKDIKCITEKAKISLTHKAIEKRKKKKKPPAFSKSPSYQRLNPNIKC